jgi:protein O-GlcNAc transferase
MIAGTMDVSLPQNFWDPIRLAVVKNILGYVPSFNSRGTVISPPQAVSSAPIVAYISRQGAGRRLIENHDRELVAALKELENEGICELKVARMETMSIREQIELAARSTVRSMHG